MFVHVLICCHPDRSIENAIIFIFNRLNVVNNSNDNKNNCEITKKKRNDSDFQIVPMQNLQKNLPLKIDTNTHISLIWINAKFESNFLKCHSLCALFTNVSSPSVRLAMRIMLMIMMNTPEDQAVCSRTFKTSKKNNQEYKIQLTHTMSSEDIQNATCIHNVSRMEQGNQSEEGK